MPRRRTSARAIPTEPEAAGVVALPASVKSATRVLQVFELFDTLRIPLRVGTVATRLDYPQSSTSVLLHSLVRLGYLAADPATRTFMPTPRMGLLGSWCVAEPARNGSMQRLMDRLSRATGQTIILAGRNGIYAQYFHVVQATRPLRMHVPVGAMRPLVCSTAGFVLLRDTGDGEVRALVRRANAEAAPGQPPIVAADVLRRVAQARDEGYAFSRALVTPGTGMMCVRLPAAGPGAEAMSIGVSGWVETMEQEREQVLAAIRDAVADYLPAEDSSRL